LRTSEELHEDDEAYVWIEGTGEQSRTLGTFRFEGERLTFETLSKERAERARQMLEQRAGDAVRYRVTTLEDLEQALAHPRPPAEPPAIPPEIQARVVAEYYERHYREWPDHSLPALGDHTPREAARLKRLRPKLVAILKMMENRAERGRREGRPAYDFGWMWAELGLERPE